VLLVTPPPLGDRFTLVGGGYNTNRCTTQIVSKLSEKTLSNITKLVEEHELLLAELAASSAKIGIKNVQILRDNISVLYEQNLQMMRALRCDNWKNAVTRAQRLMRNSEDTFDPGPTHHPR
jgi:hypothetical protein